MNDDTRRLVLDYVYVARVVRTHDQQLGAGLLPTDTGRKERNSHSRRMLW
jgi:hypothetical protein